MEAYTIISLVDIKCNCMLVDIFHAILPDETMITDVYAFIPNKGYKVIRID